MIMMMKCFFLPFFFFLSLSLSSVFLVCLCLFGMECLAFHTFISQVIALFFHLKNRLASPVSTLLHNNNLLACVTLPSLITLFCLTTHRSNVYIAKSACHTTVILIIIIPIHSFFIVYKKACMRVSLSLKKTLHYFFSFSFIFFNADKQEE